MIKIDVITGFLGAGKTTFLKMLLEKQIFGDEKVLIIENEFGDVPIDHHILENDQYSMIEISGGCICCTLKVDIIEALAAIAVNEMPDRILIEPSGVFMVEDIFEIMTNRMVVDDYVINGIYTIVDVKHFQINQMRYAPFYMSQLKYANHIILSKVSEYKIELIDDILDRLEEFNDHARIYALPMAAMFSEDLKEMFYPAQSLDDHLHHTTTGETSHTNIKSIGIQSVQDFNKSQFLALIESVKDGCFGNVLRLKGYMVVEQQRYLLNYAFGDLNMTAVEKGPSMATFIGEELKMVQLREAFSNVQDLFRIVKA